MYKTNLSISNLSIFTKSGYYDEDVKRQRKFDVNISSEDYWDIITWREEKDGKEFGLSLRDHYVLYILFSSERCYW